MANMAKKELTLKDRLSRLTFIQACKLLGHEGSKLIMQGGKFEINLIEENVFLDNKLFQLFIDGAVVTINLNGNAAGSCILTVINARLLVNISEQHLP